MIILSNQLILHHKHLTMKRILNLAIATVLTVMLASCGSTGSSPMKAKQEALAKLKTEQAKLADQIRQLENELAAMDTTGKLAKFKAVNIQVLSQEPFSHFIDVQGHVDAQENVTLTAKTAGTVTRVLVSEGQNVSQGQLLAELDSDIYQKQLETAQTQLAFATDVYNRQKKLWDQKIGSEVQYLSAKSNKETLEKQVQVLQETIDLTRIKAPLNGVVDRVDLKVGQMAAPGFPALRIVNLGSLKVVSEVAEAYTAKVNRGNAVSVYFPDLDRTIESKVTYAAKVINPLTRTFTAEVALQGDVNDLRPNMVAVLRIRDYQADSALVIPINVVLNVGSNPFVYVASTENGRQVARRREIVLGKNYKGKTEVLSGLNPQDRLITSGYSELADGMEIRF